MKTNPSDQACREKSLNIASSFIIQAPAGSGKTTLLTSRFMSLVKAKIDLNKILAITFTKKASDEMQTRINKQLKEIRHPQANSKLPIMTFDAFCNQFNTFIGHDTTIHEFPEEVYYQSAINLINDTDEVLQKYILQILEYLNGNLEDMIKLLSNLLQTRDQWITQVLQPDISSNHNACYAAAQQHADYILSNIPKETRIQIANVLKYISNNITLSNNKTITNYSLEKNNLDFLYLLKQFCIISIKSDNEWREKVDSRQGFIPVSKIKSKAEKAKALEIKSTYQNIIKNLKQTQNLKNYFIMLKLLPLEKNSSENTQSIMSAIEYCLPRLMAHFKIISLNNKTQDFLENSINTIDIISKQHTDFIEVLEKINNINHILLDEAQDTSWVQYKLLKAITQDWQPNDGNSLFIVGDPSQSIYRFRQAQVSLFEHIRNFGINNIKLEPIYLTNNFRSQANIINWVNETCIRLFPNFIDFSLGAIQYHPSIATRSPKNNVNVLLADNSLIESQINILVNDIKLNLLKDINFKCAILLKTRTHGAKLIQKLKQEKISFFADSLNPIMQSQIILDLLSLTYAVNNLYDKNNWLSALRAPWLGFSLHEIYQLSSYNTVIDALFKNSTLDTPFAQKCSRAYFYMQKAINQLSYKKNHEIIGDLWHQLKGPSTLYSTIEIDSCNKFFEILKNLDNQQNIRNLEQRLANLYIDQATNTDDFTCQIMTIHKSKGLEFDNVYLPFICQPANKQSKTLLLWHNIINKNNDNLCILSTSSSSNKEADLTLYLKEIERQKDTFESIRLFYVAITRAKNNLTIIANSEKISKSSILKLILPHINNVKNIKCKNSDIEKEISYTSISKSISKINKCDIKQNKWSPQKHIQTTLSLQFFGTLTHKLLEILSNDGLRQNYSNLEKQIIFYLLEHNIPLQQQKVYLQKLKKLYFKISYNKKLQWILKPHTDASSELEIVVNSNWYRIDRTFVENNNRWIIDYKTGNLPLLNYKEFLYNKYHQTLELYAKYFQEKNIYLAIYHVEKEIFLYWKY